MSFLCLWPRRLVTAVQSPEEQRSMSNPVPPSGPPPYANQYAHSAQQSHMQGSAPGGPQYPQGGYQQPKTKGLAIASMVVGIVSLVFSDLAVLGIVGGLAAIALGIVALVKKQSTGMSVTGLVTGGIALLASIGILVGSAMVYNSLSNYTPPSIEAVEQETAEPEAVTTEAADDEEAESEEAEAEPTEAAEEWVTVAEISGSADQQSDTIVLSGGKVRITYTFEDSTGYGTIVGAIYLLDEGVDIMEDGGIPDVMVTEAGSGDTILRKGEGEYYLRISAANTSYTVTVEELK